MDKTIFVFAPYIKTEVLEKLLDGIQGSKVVVTTWGFRDLQLGSSELELYPFCKKNGIALYVIGDMHLKVYSVDLESAILATGNVSHRGLVSEDNYEAGTMIEKMKPEDRLHFEKIRRKGRLVDDVMFEEYSRWLEQNRVELPSEDEIGSIISESNRDIFLVSALPMTRSVDDLVEGYVRVSEGKAPSEDRETAACVFHDLANYGIDPGLTRDKFMHELSIRFFAHPFVKKIDEFINPESYFGRIKEWVQENCTDVPVPSRRELTGNVQVLLEWFERLGGDRYVIDIPGARSQRIRKV